jgi:spore coat protein CotH
MQAEIKVLARFDRNGDGWLNAEERTAAREFLKEERSSRGGFGGPPRFGRGRENSGPPAKGAKVSPKDVKSFPDAGLYDAGVLRTLFFEFENPQWESELSDFHGTDVDVPAKLTVDGKTYDGVGVRFRGMSSYFMVGNGYKRSMNISIDYIESKQRLYGVKTLNLLNSHGDATMLRSVLYSTIARNYLPAPDVNLVRVVIQGEDWGIYSNQEQFNKDFLRRWFKSAKGVRWKVPGGPMGGGGLVYRGDDVENYKRQYEIKTDDAEEAARGWHALVQLCRTLDATPPAELEKALSPMLDIDGALRFLAIENALVNGDGYWTRASDFSLFLDERGVFHVIPHDMNECFSSGGGPGGPGGPGGRRGRGGRPQGPGGEGGPQTGSRPALPDGPGGFGGPPGFGGPGRGGPGGFGGGAGVKTDPLVAMQDSGKPLLSKLLAAPGLKDRYLSYVKQIAETWLDWKKLEPVISRYVKMIDAEVAADTHKLDSYEAFRAAVGLAPPEVVETGANTENRPRGEMSLRSFVEQRRAFLLNHDAIKSLRTQPGQARK